MECFIVSEGNPDLVLTVEEKSQQEGARLIIYNFIGDDSQRWIIQGTHILSKLSGQAIDIKDGEGLGHQIIQSQAHNSNSQNWFLYPDGTIRTQNNFCLDINEVRFESGNIVIAWEPNNGLNQKWRIVTKK